MELNKLTYDEIEDIKDYIKTRLKWDHIQVGKIDLLNKAVLNLLEICKYDISEIYSIKDWSSRHLVEYLADNDFYILDGVFYDWRDKRI